MSAASKILSVILRIGQLCCSLIVLGIIGHFFWRIGKAGNTQADNRLIYTLVLASISTVLSLLFMIPFKLGFYACPLDFCFFGLWLVDFILLELLTGINTCNAVWYYNYWGYYWGGFWRTPIVVTGPVSIGWSGCASWKTVLAFSFIASMAFLLSSFLGAYVVTKYREEKKMGMRTAPLAPKPEQGGVFENQPPRDPHAPSNGVPPITV